jgi:hypothetical protein
MTRLSTAIAVIAVLVLLLPAAAIRVVKQHERGVQSAASGNGVALSASG